MNPPKTEQSEAQGIPESRSYICGFCGVFFFFFFCFVLFCFSFISFSFVFHLLVMKINLFHLQGQHKIFGYLQLPCQLFCSWLLLCSYILTLEIYLERYKDNLSTAYIICKREERRFDCLSKEI